MQLFFFSVLAFVSALAIGIDLFKPTHFLYVDPMEIVTAFNGKPLRSFLNKTASTICDKVNENVQVVNSKEKGLNMMYTLIVLGLVIFAFSFLALAIGKGL